MGLYQFTADLLGPKWTCRYKRMCVCDGENKAGAAAVVARMGGAHRLCRTRTGFRPGRTTRGFRTPRGVCQGTGRRGVG
jgi:hypothetical protein